MLDVLLVLDTLLKEHITWSYQIRNHFKFTYTMHYTIDLIVDGFHRVVISDTLDQDYVEVWTDAHSSHEDGVRVKKSSLLEYIIFILKEDFNI